MDHQIPARSPDLELINKKQNNNNNKKKTKKKERILPIQRVKIKENENIDKYLNLAGELKKLWNIKVKIIAIAVCTLGTVSKKQEKGPEGQEISGIIKTILTTAQLRSARIMRRVLVTGGENLIKGINSRAVTFVKYSGPLIKWTRKELR